MRRKWIVFAPLAVMLFVAIGGLLVQQLWNWLMPALAGWRHITFWQAVGVLALCRILFGGIGRHGFRGPGFRHRLAARWEHMSPEDRDRFRESMRGRCGFGSQTPPATT